MNSAAAAIFLAGVFLPLITSSSLDVIEETDAHTLNSAVCGGRVSVGGEISYKLDAEYANDERCIWTVANGFAGYRVVLELLSVDFNDPGDYLEVYFENYDKIQRYSQMNATGARLSLAYPSLVYIVLRTDGQGQGTGFRLKHSMQRVCNLPDCILFAFPGQQYAYQDRSGSFEYETTFREYGHYSWTINPAGAELTKLGIQYLQLNDYIRNGSELQVYSAQPGAAVLLGNYTHVSSTNPELIPNFSPKEPVIFYMYTYYEVTGADKGLQVYWNRDSPSEENPDPSAAQSSFGHGTILACLCMLSHLFIAFLKK